MVCIIDDREDVWNMASNLIQVKPYNFFQHTGDINAPPGLAKQNSNNDALGVNLDDIKKIAGDDLPDSESIQETEENKDKNVETEADADAEKKDEIETNITMPKTPDISKVSDDETAPEEAELPKKSKTVIPNKALPSDSDADMVDVEDPDDYLMYLESILIKIHDRFYSFYETNNKVTPYSSWNFSVLC